MEFTSATPVTGLILQTFIEYLLAPLLIGQDPSDTAMLWQRMYWNGLLRRGGDGLMRNANAAVDFALWDIKGNARHYRFGACLVGYDRQFQLTAAAQRICHQINLQNGRLSILPPDIVRSR